MNEPKTILSRKYAPLIKSNNRYHIITGGRGSGKSFAVNVFLLFLTYQQDEKILFTRKTLTSAHISIIPEFTEKIDLLELRQDFGIKRTEIVNKTTGSSIIFKGLQSGSKDNTANLKSLQGVTAWVLDEAEELNDEKVFDDIDLSIRKTDKQNRIILILNPATKEHFIYKRFFERQGVQPGSNTEKDNTTYIHTTYLDNFKNLNQSFIDRVEQIKRINPDKYKHQIEGGWLEKAEGVIFSNWRIGEFENNGNTIFGQDYGFAVDPTTLIEVSVFTQRKEIYLKEHLYKSGMSTSEIFEMNKLIAGDSLIIGDNAEPRLISELSNLGNNIEAAEKGQGSVTAGISNMQDYELIISPDSKNLVKELNNYAWNDKKKSTPIDDYNHLIDGARYAITRYLKPKKKEAFIF